MGLIHELLKFRRCSSKGSEQSQRNSTYLFESEESRYASENDGDSYGWTGHCAGNGAGQDPRSGDALPDNHVM
jgi:hypothetical protein